MGPGDEIGHYRIVRMLGRGGMGEVYLATDRRLNRPVALKLLRAEISDDPISAARFRREALAASAITHPNICSIYDIGEWSGRTYIAMEYIEGASLSEMIRAGPVETQEAIEITIQIADALEEARKKNIVHRDIKSSNILLTSRKQVKLLDFGLARYSPNVSSESLASASTEARLTQPQMVMGTVPYMSPEQALGHPVDHRTDIFSFGVVLYEMLTAKLPFSGNTQTEVIDAVLHKDPAPISRFNDKVPDGLSRVIQKMLQKDVENRYQSVHEVWSDLRQIRGESGAVRQEIKPIWVRQKRIVFAAVLIAIAIAAGIFLFLRKNIPAPSLPVSNISSIVALPCKVYGASDVTYLTDAIPSTLSTLLGQVDGLETKMPPSSVEVEQVKGDLDKIADAYNVNAFVVSSINAQGDRLIINLQLIEPRSRRVLWSRQYEGTRGTYNEMTRQAADGIRHVLRPISNTIASSNGLASTSEAELAFRQGLHYSYRYNNQKSAADFDAAFQSFQRALDLDPKFADAAAEIAWIYGMKSQSHNLPDKWIEEANRWARKALAINDRCSKGWSALFGLGFAESLEYALRAVKYGPKDSYAHNNLGIFLEGETVTLALSAYQTASSLDPLYLAPPGNAAGILYVLGRRNEAMSKLEAVLALEPDRPNLLGLKMLNLSELGRREDITMLARKLEQLNAEEKLALWRLQITQFVIAASENQIELSESLFHDIKRNLNSRSDVDFWTSVTITLVPALIRHKRIDDVIDALNKGLAAGYTIPYDLILQNPYYKTVRHEPWLIDHVARSREKLEETLSLLEKARQRGELPAYLEKPMADLRAQISEK